MNTTTIEAPASLVRTLHIIYALHALGLVLGAFGAASVIGSFLFGWPSIIAVIISYVKRGEARGTWLESHFSWAIRTFWVALIWALLVALVSIPLAIILVGIAATPWRGTTDAPLSVAVRPRGKKAVRASKAASRARPANTATANDAMSGLTPRQQRIMTLSMGIGHALMVGSFVAAWLLSDHVGHAVAACFTVITPAFFAYGVGSAVRNGAWHAGVTLVMAGVVFLLFAAGLWLFT
jgi:uncharacterized membrane protein